MTPTGYFTMCITGNWPEKQPVHCFKIPQLVDDSYFTELHLPHPQNYPELELAGTILSLVEYVDPIIKDKVFTQQLTEVANNYVQKVRQGLPQGVELKRVKPLAVKKAA